MERYSRHNFQVEVRVYRYDERETDNYARGLAVDPPREIDVYKAERFMTYKDSIYDVIDEMKLEADQAVEDFIEECPHDDTEHLISVSAPDEEDPSLVECMDCGQVIELDEAL